MRKTGPLAESHANREFFIFFLYEHFRSIIRWTLYRNRPVEIEEEMNAGHTQMAREISGCEDRHTAHSWMSKQMQYWRFIRTSSTRNMRSLMPNAKNRLDDVQRAQDSTLLSPFNAQSACQCQHKV